MDEYRVKAELHIPTYVIALLIVGGIVVILAIILPIVLLLKPKKTPDPTPSAIPSSSPVEQFTPLAPEALVAQVLFPYIDGIEKRTIQVSSSSEQKVLVNVVGSNSKSAWVNLDLDSTLDTTTTIMFSPDTITAWVSSYGTEIIMADSTLDTQWHTGSNSLLTTPTYSSLSWPRSDLSNPYFFMSATWKQVSDTLTFFLHDPGTNQITIEVQDRNSYYSALSTPVPNVQSGLDVSVGNMVCTTNQSYVSFGFTSPLLNTFYYVTFMTPLTPHGLQTLTYDFNVERLRYTSMSYDGVWLLVLTNVNLRLYRRNLLNNQLDFQLSDIIVLDGSPSVCGMETNFDMTVPSSVCWCVIGTSEPVTNSICFSTTGQFQRSRAYAIPSTVLEDTTGPVTVYAKPDVLFITSSDSLGNIEYVLLNNTEI